MLIHLKIIGVSLMFLALMHFYFPKYFHWSKELKSLSLMNRQMMIYHTFFIALMVFLMGLLCFTSAEEIVTTHLGKSVALGMAIFWTLRFFVQLFGYSTKLWRGKVFETIVHVFFTVFWLYLSSIFWIIYIMRPNFYYT